jgi:hypothetical protein
MSHCGVRKAAKNDAANRFSGCGKAKKTRPDNLMTVSESAAT